MNTTNDQNEEIDFSKAEAILDEYEGVHGALIPVLQKIQGAYGYLQEPVINLVAERMNMSASEIVGVATFYAQFHLKPRGVHIIKVCCGTACHVKGAPNIVGKFSEVLDVPVGSTTEDKLFTLEEVACIGACSLAPVAMIDEDVHGKLGPDNVPSIVEEVK
ncbi:MAG: NADH-quinone oxidoreductase subunit NuoE [Candidatus Scalindua sp. AMX11]|nr:MAG: NADH-quinone oxidoreductase subunit NuoE [Candidatus Scalindua sp.]NOG82750.1 NADH-quinone oxidoreductase subunit NuoE [Planctomycetota bacterium]RZV95319.1 MAG: NADH-quinone oxidoreductase subunit NuoE [Candidatus Scalindua sp. SCAELEC01]TDE66198.1 MAG: NADH-quinone oxidoreductase subunit NuoE [Candidatus Scalindua sp. AMX11]GJQ57818.1 MAG: NADH dehydrogenase subunit E [Candidatus Scalindua sp.]